jgi:hypothetical protein
LNRNESIDALDCDLRFQTVTPFLSPDPTTLSGTLRVPLGFETANAEDPPDPITVADAGRIEANGSYGYSEAFTHWFKYDDTGVVNPDSGWDLDTAAYVATESSLAFRPYGGHMAHNRIDLYLTMVNPLRVQHYKLTTAGDINSTWVFQQEFTPIRGQMGVYLPATGDRLYTCDDVDGVVRYYTLSTPWDIGDTSRTLIESKDLSILGANDAPRDVHFSADGLQMFIIKPATGIRVIEQYTLSTPFVPSSCGTGPVHTFDYATPTGAGACYSLMLDPSGSRMYIMDNSAKDAWMFKLSQPNDLSTATYTAGDTYDFSALGDPGIFMMFLNTSGGGFYITGSTSNKLHSYSMTGDILWNPVLGTPGYYIVNKEESDWKLYFDPIVAGPNVPLYTNSSTNVFPPKTGWELDEFTGDLPTISYTLGGGGASTGLNHYHDILHNEGGSVPKGLYEIHERGTYIAASAVSQDVHERVYFSVPGGGLYDRGRTDGAGDFIEREVGVAPPVSPDGIDLPLVSDRSVSDPLAFTAKWYYRVETNAAPFTTLVEGEITDAATSVVFSHDFNDANEPVYRYTYNKDYRSSSASGHVAYGDSGDTYDRATHNFIMYAELFSPGGVLLGTVYPTPSVLKENTDAYIGGTLADGVTYQGDSAEVTDNKEFTDLKAIPAGTEYSQYRSYLFTYVTDRDEESAPSAATDVVAVTPMGKASLTLHVNNAPVGASIARLYRTETTDAGTAFFFVDDVTLTGSATETYVDYIISADLAGDTLQTKDWAAPPAGLKGLVLSTKGFYAAYLESKLYLSIPHIAYAWPTDYAIDFTGSIRHIARYGDALAVFTDQEIALIVGNTPLEVRKIKVEGFEVLTSPFSTAEMDGLLYFATATGIAALSGTNVAMATDELMSETWWRANINADEVRLVAFDGAVYLLNEPDSAVYRIGVGEAGGGLVRLSDPQVQDLYTSSFFDGVVVLKSTALDEYVFNTGATVNRTASWRSRMETAPIPIAPISARALADTYPLTLKVYNESGIQQTLTLADDSVRKMPVMRRGREWSFEIEGASTIVNLEVGTSGRVR